jgi:hypothetical protein
MNSATDHGYSIAGQLPVASLPNWCHYTQAEFDAFGWSTLTRGQLEMSETHGLDYESARDCTPRWYAVSFGNGNDGVSHTFPDYYVRTSDPFRLAAAAMIGNFNKPAGKAFAVENTEVDGEADYTISATILNPPEDETEEEESTEWDCPVCAHCNPADVDSCEECEEERPEDEEEDNGSWCDANGAWLICEVFPVDDSDYDFIGLLFLPFQTVNGRPAYASLSDCFDDADLTLADTV